MTHSVNSICTYLLTYLLTDILAITIRTTDIIELAVTVNDGFLDLLHVTDDLVKLKQIGRQLFDLLTDQQPHIAMNSLHFYMTHSLDASTLLYGASS